MKLGKKARNGIVERQFAFFLKFQQCHGGELFGYGADVEQGGVVYVCHGVEPCFSVTAVKDNRVAFGDQDDRSRIVCLKH